MEYTLWDGTTALTWEKAFPYPADVLENTKLLFVSELLSIVFFYFTLFVFYFSSKFFLPSYEVFKIFFAIWVYVSTNLIVFLRLLAAASLLLFYSNVSYIL